MPFLGVVSLMPNEREHELDALHKALDELDAHITKYGGLYAAYSFLVQYRALLTHKWDEVQDLLQGLQLKVDNDG